MERLRNPIFLVLLVLLFVEVLIIFPSRVDHSGEDPLPDDTEQTTPLSGPAEQKMEGVHLVESQGGNRDWELFAKAAEGDQRLAWSLRDVRVLFYKDEQVEFTVTGREGTIDTKSRDMRIRGSVQVVSGNGYQFRTEEVSYDARRRRILSPGSVLMTSPADRDGAGMTVQGVRMVADVERSWMQIASNVRANKPLRQGRKMSLTSDSAEFSGRNREAHFKGKVVMTYGDSKIEGPEALFRTGSANEISNILVRGGIKVTDQNKFATSEDLDLDLISDRFVFTGQPKVYQDSDELTGERIIFLEGGKKVRVESVRARTKEPNR